MNDPTPHDRDDRIERRLESLPDATAADAFQDALRDAFTSGSIASSADRRPGRMRRARWAIPIAAAAALVIGLLVFTGGEPRPEVIGVVGRGDVRIDGRAVAVGDREALASALADANDVDLPAGARLTVRFPGFATFEIEGGSAVVLPRPGRPQVGRVTTGELRLKTEPGFAGSRMRIRTPEGLVVVTGTLLSVQRGPMGTCVCVLEGTARVGRDDADLESVRPGMRKTIGLGGETGISPVKPMHRDGVVDFADRLARYSSGTARTDRR